MNQTPIPVEHQAYLKGDLRILLQPFLTFRVYVRFKQPKGFKRTFYGNEFSCTYKQLQYGKVPQIILDKLKGYTDLIQLIEEKLKNRYTHAKIYMRLPGCTEFDKMCRHYEDGELKDCNDPVINEDERMTLYYLVKKGVVYIAEKDPAQEDFTIK